MARPEKLPERKWAAIEGVECPSFDTTPFVREKPLSEMRVAIVSSAGVHLRGDKTFAPGEGEYRTIPADTSPADIVMSHVSTNFDRTGFQQDLNVVLPLERIKELEADGTIGEVSVNHYSFMGATEPAAMEESARGLGQKLRADSVDAVILLPV